MKRIYIKAFTATNLGDDLFVKVLCERYPKHRFYMHAVDFRDQALLPIPNLTVFSRSTEKGKWMQRIQKMIRKCGFDIDFAYDAQVYIGGSIFIEFKNPDYYQGYFKNLYSSKIRPNIPYFILGANFGPHYTTEFVEKHKAYFSHQVDDLCMRDKTSYNLFKELPHVRYAPDILCTYQMPSVPKKNMVLISCIFNESREEISQFDNDAYEKKMVELCEYYITQNKEICLLSMCNQQQDHVMCNRIKTHFNQHVEVVEYQGNIDEVVKLFASAEYVIASRFHAMILGWLAKTPVFPIYYSNKTLNVILDYGFKGSYADINDFSTLSCQEIDANRIHQYLFNTEEIQSEAQKHFLKLDQFLS